MMSSFFKLYASCIPTKGFSRSIITDIQNGKFYFIPNGLYEILVELKKSNSKKILKNHAKDGLTKDLLDGYITYLIEHNLGFYTDIPDQFPDIKVECFSPNKVEDAIIEWSNFHEMNYDGISSQLSSLNCKHIEVRAYSESKLSSVIPFLENLNRTSIRGVELIFPFSKENHLIMNEIIKKFPVVSKLILHNSNCKKMINDKILLVKKPLSKNKCGKLGENFTINLQHYLRSQIENPCLAKKVTIDENGFILNCPIVKPTKQFHIDSNKISEVIDDKVFNKIWNIKKSEIETCKICEFRNICGDCRGGVSEYSKPRFCNYNPKTMQYEN